VIWRLHARYERTAAPPYAGANTISVVSSFNGRSPSRYSATSGVTKNIVITAKIFTLGATVVLSLL